MTDRTTTRSGKMTINLPGVIKTLGESLYSDPSVSVRELVQNANDTCVVRQVDDTAAPASEIHIKIDSWKRLLTIEDNGAGMTEDEVKQFLTVIGSSNTDKVRTRLQSMGQGSMAQRLIGRFGLGLLSAFIIGDRVEFSTRSYKEDSEAIWWACDGGQDYEMGPTQKDKIGTTVTVYISPNHLGILEHNDLEQLIRTYADFLQIPIFIDPFPNPVNAMTAPWDREATLAEYRKFIQDRYPNEAILDVVPLEISEDDGEFIVNGVLFIPKQPLFIVKEHGDATVYVRRMFITKDDRTLLPEWAKFVRGIIASPNLRETTSREAILLDENHERVKKAVGHAILEYLTRASAENPRLFKEIVTNHNLVIKAWAIASDELFERIKDIVLFTTDAGMINLRRYFEMSRYSKLGDEYDDGKKYIFYFTTAGGAGQHTVLFSAKGLRVIDATQFPDDGFIRKYADNHEDVIARRIDVSAGFIFEELEQREQKWAELEDVYGAQRLDAKVVRFVPEDVPAVLIFPEVEPVTDQVEQLINDPKLSSPLKNLVKQMWEDREKRRKGQISGGGVLYINANSPIIQKLVDLDIHDYEIQGVLMTIYNNALMLSTQGAKRAVTQENAKRIFDSNNRTIDSLMDKIHEVRDLKASQFVEQTTKSVEPVAEDDTKPTVVITQSDVTQTKHVTCFVALPFSNEYEVVVEALRDVLEAPPYFWEVVRPDKRIFANDIDENIAYWIARSHCFAVDLSEGDSDVMMELGQIYWSYPERLLFLLERKGTERLLTDLLGGRVRISYNWTDKPKQVQIANDFRTAFEKFEDIKKLQGNSRYLSIRVLQELEFIRKELSEELAKRYETVEEFLAKDAATVSREVGRRLAPKGIVQEIQSALRELCDL